MSVLTVYSNYMLGFCMYWAESMYLVCIRSYVRRRRLDSANHDFIFNITRWFCIPM